MSHITCSKCNGGKTIPRFKWFPWFFPKECDLCGGAGTVYVEPPPHEVRQRQFERVMRTPIHHENIPLEKRKAFPDRSYHEDFRDTHPLEVLLPASTDSSFRDESDDEPPRPDITSGEGGDFGGGGASGSFGPVEASASESESCRAESYAESASATADSTSGSGGSTTPD